MVQVLDENDNKPIFPEKVYKIKLPERERKKKSEPIYRVFAYDRDDGPNGDLSYSIVDGNDDGKFFIDPKTAVVSSRKAFTAGSYDILTVCKISFIVKRLPKMFYDIFLSASGIDVSNESVHVQNLISWLNVSVMWEDDLGLYHAQYFSEPVHFVPVQVQSEPQNAHSDCLHVPPGGPGGPLVCSCDLHVG